MSPPAGSAHAANGAASKRQENVEGTSSEAKVNAGLAISVDDPSAGPEVMVVSGATVSRACQSSMPRTPSSALKMRPPRNGVRLAGSKSAAPGAPSVKSVVPVLVPSVRQSS